MRPRSVTLIVLLALALRLSVGPHPCHGMAPAAPAVHASCHQESQPKAPQPGDEDCCKGGNSLCENACQTAAVLQVILPSPMLLSFQEQVSSPESRATPPVVFPIDHVPLA